MERKNKDKTILIGYWPGKRWKQARAVHSLEGCSPTLTAEMGAKGNNYVYILEGGKMEGKDDKKTKCKMVGMLPIKGNESIRRVYSADHLAPSVVTNGGGNHEIKVILWGGIGDKKSNKGTQWYEQNRIYDANGLATALPAEMAFHPNYKTEGDNKMKKPRIRKLTEGECYRLMGFEEKDTEACKAVGQSKANIYHQAGDSIVTTVLMGIFGELLEVPDYQAKIEAYADKLAGECK